MSTEELWRELVDAHCHPTDDPLLRRLPHSNSSHEQDAPATKIDLDALAKRLTDAQVGTVCIMSTNDEDQELVAGLATRCGSDRVTPAFGHHPWFVHRISLRDSVSKEEHYRSLFPDSPSLSGPNGEDVPELDLILPALPDPIPLRQVVDQLRNHLQQYPHAILGEVGIDKSFRLPFPREAHERLDDSRPGDDISTRRRLSRLQTPLPHQMTVLKAQVGVAISLRRSISYHSVRTAGATTELLRDLCHEFPRGWDETPGFQHTNIDLHSCTISAESLTQIQKTHRNVFVSFSTTINARQKGLAEQIEACDPERLLSESDWHSAEGLAERVWEIIDLFCKSKRLGEHLGLGKLGEDERRRAVVQQLRKNWQRFLSSNDYTEDGD